MIPRWRPDYAEPEKKISEAPHDYELSAIARRARGESRRPRRPLAAAPGAAGLFGGGRPSGDPIAQGRPTSWGLGRISFYGQPGDAPGFAETPPDPKPPTLPGGGTLVPDAPRPPAPPPPPSSTPPATSTVPGPVSSPPSLSEPPEPPARGGPPSTVPSIFGDVIRAIPTGRSLDLSPTFIPPITVASSEIFEDAPPTTPYDTAPRASAPPPDVVGTSGAPGTAGAPGVPGVPGAPGTAGLPPIAASPRDIFEDAPPTTPYDAPRAPAPSPGVPIPPTGDDIGGAGYALDLGVPPMPSTGNDIGGAGYAFDLGVPPMPPTGHDIGGAGYAVDLGVPPMPSTGNDIGGAGYAVDLGIPFGGGVYGIPGMPGTPGAPGSEFGALPGTGQGDPDTTSPADIVARDPMGALNTVLGIITTATSDEEDWKKALTIGMHLFAAYPWLADAMGLPQFDIPGGSGALTGLAGLAQIAQAIGGDGDAPERALRGLGGLLQTYGGASQLTSALPSVPYLGAAAALFSAAASGSRGGLGGVAGSLLASGIGALAGPAGSLLLPMHDIARAFTPVKPNLTKSQREQLEAGQVNTMAQSLAREIELASTPEELWESIARYADRSSNQIVPGVGSLEEAMANPDAINVQLQAGVNPDMLAQANEGLTRLLRSTMGLFAAAADGNPLALSVLEQRQTARQDFIDKAGALSAYDYSVGGGEGGNEMIQETRPTSLADLMDRLGLFSARPDVPSGWRANYQDLPAHWSATPDLLKLPAEAFRRYSVEDLVAALYESQAGSGEGGANIVGVTPRFDPASPDVLDRIEAELARRAATPRWTNTA
jgi:hypothetical protein